MIRFIVLWVTLVFPSQSMGSNYAQALITGKTGYAFQFFW